MPEEQRNPYIPEKPETYYLVCLRRGPTYHKMESPEDLELHNRHLAYLKSLGDAGKLLIWGPTVNGPDDLRGIAIARVSSEAEIRDLMAQDPRTQAGHFTIDVVAWMGDSEAWRPR